MPSIAEVADGSQTASLDTEHTLSTQTDAEVFVLAVDLSNMVGGDVTILRVKTKIRSSSSSVLAFEQTFTGEQDAPAVWSEPVPSAHQAVFTLEQTDGTGRAYPWSVLKVV